MSLRKTQSLIIGNRYDVFWKRPNQRQWYFTSELVDLNLTKEVFASEPVVDKAIFANGKVIDLTHPELLLVELEDES